MKKLYMVCIFPFMKKAVFIFVVHIIMEQLCIKI